MTLCVSACHRTPGGVLSAKQMEDLLVDIHKSEALVENGTVKFTTADKKEALRESIFRKHHIDKAQFDTSLMWYGRNLDKYILIYDRVILRLKEQEAQVSGLVTDDNTQTVTTRPGDSVNIWQRENAFIFEPRAGRQTFTFEFNTDENFREQDIFVLKFRFGMLPGREVTDYPKAILALKQSNDSIRYTAADIRQDGTATLMLTSDKGTKAVKIFGNIMVPASLGYTALYADSLSLMRIRYREGILPAASKPVLPPKRDMMLPDRQAIGMDSVALVPMADSIQKQR
ncbi:MAG: DUF4296 domain-containing protein [Coprobacter sp.]|nr:DUF4296 domain-containing protein [Coprobacter sp.]